MFCAEADMMQNKKRKYDRDDDREGREKTPEEPVEDPLKDAATLYVGNLYVRSYAEASQS